MDVYEGRQRQSSATQNAQSTQKKRSTTKAIKKFLSRLMKLVPEKKKVERDDYIYVAIPIDSFEDEDESDKQVNRVSDKKRKRKSVRNRGEKVCKIDRKRQSNFETSQRELIFKAKDHSGDTHSNKVCNGEGDDFSCELKECAKSSERLKQIIAPDQGCQSYAKGTGGSDETEYYPESKSTECYEDDCIKHSGLCEELGCEYDDEFEDRNDSDCECLDESLDENETQDDIDELAEECFYHSKKSLEKICKKYRSYDEQFKGNVESTSKILYTSDSVSDVPYSWAEIKQEMIKEVECTCGETYKINCMNTAPDGPDYSVMYNDTKYLKEQQDEGEKNGESKDDCCLCANECISSLEVEDTDETFNASLNEEHAYFTEALVDGSGENTCIKKNKRFSYSLARKQDRVESDDKVKFNENEKNSLYTEYTEWHEGHKIKCKKNENENVARLSHHTLGCGDIKMPSEIKGRQYFSHCYTNRNCNNTNSIANEVNETTETNEEHSNETETENVDNVFPENASDEGDGTDSESDDMFSTSVKDECTFGDDDFYFMPQREENGRLSTCSSNSSVYAKDAPADDPALVFSSNLGGDLHDKEAVSAFNCSSVYMPGPENLEEPPLFASPDSETVLSGGFSHIMNMVDAAKKGALGSRQEDFSLNLTSFAHDKFEMCKKMFTSLGKTYAASIDDCQDTTPGSSGGPNQCTSKVGGEKDDQHTAVNPDNTQQNYEEEADTEDTEEEEDSTDDEGEVDIGQGDEEASHFFLSEEHEENLPNPPMVCSNIVNNCEDETGEPEEIGGTRETDKIEADEIEETGDLTDEDDDEEEEDEEKYKQYIESDREESPNIFTLEVDKTIPCSPASYSIVEQFDKEVADEKAQYTEIGDEENDNGESSDESSDESEDSEKDESDAWYDDKQSTDYHNELLNGISDCFMTEQNALVVATSCVLEDSQSDHRIEGAAECVNDDSDDSEEEEEEEEDKEIPANDESRPQVDVGVDERDDQSPSSGHRNVEVLACYIADKDESSTSIVKTSAVYTRSTQEEGEECVDASQQGIETYACHDMSNEEMHDSQVSAACGVNYACESKSNHEMEMELRNTSNESQSLFPTFDRAENLDEPLESPPRAVSSSRSGTDKNSELEYSAQNFFKWMRKCRENEKNRSIGQFIFGGGEDQEESHKNSSENTAEGIDVCHEETFEPSFEGEMDQIVPNFSDVMPSLNSHSPGGSRCRILERAEGQDCITNEDGVKVFPFPCQPQFGASAAKQTTPGAKVLIVDGQTGNAMEMNCPNELVDDENETKETETRETQQPTGSRASTPKPLPIRITSDDGADKRSRSGSRSGFNVKGRSPSRKRASRSRSRSRSRGRSRSRNRRRSASRSRSSQRQSQTSSRWLRSQMGSPAQPTSTSGNEDEIGAKLNRALSRSPSRSRSRSRKGRSRSMASRSSSRSRRGTGSRGSNRDDSGTRLHKKSRSRSRSGSSRRRSRSRSKSGYKLSQQRQTSSPSDMKTPGRTFSSSSVHKNPSQSSVVKSASKSYRSSRPNSPSQSSVFKSASKSSRSSLQKSPSQSSVHKGGSKSSLKPSTQRDLMKQINLNLQESIKAAKNKPSLPNSPDRSYMSDLSSLAKANMEKREHAYAGIKSSSPSKRSSKSPNLGRKSRSPSVKHTSKSGSRRQSKSPITNRSKSPSVNQRSKSPSMNRRPVSAKVRSKSPNEVKNKSPNINKRSKLTSNPSTSKQRTAADIIRRPSSPNAIDNKRQSDSPKAKPQQSGARPSFSASGNNGSPVAERGIYNPPDVPTIQSGNNYSNDETGGCPGQTGAAAESRHLKNEITQKAKTDSLKRSLPKQLSATSAKRKQPKPQNSRDKNIPHWERRKEASETKVNSSSARMPNTSVTKIDNSHRLDGDGNNDRTEKETTPIVPRNMIADISSQAKEMARSEMEKRNVISGDSKSKSAEKQTPKQYRPNYGPSSTSNKKEAEKWATKRSTGSKSNPSVSKSVQGNKFQDEKGPNGPRKTKSTVYDKNQTKTKTVPSTAQRNADWRQQKDESCQQKNADGSIPNRADRPFYHLFMSLDEEKKVKMEQAEKSKAAAEEDRKNLSRWKVDSQGRLQKVTLDSDIGSGGVTKELAPRDTFKKAPDFKVAGNISSQKRRLNGVNRRVRVDYNQNKETNEYSARPNTTTQRRPTLLVPKLTVKDNKVVVTTDADKPPEPSYETNEDDMPKSPRAPPMAAFKIRSHADKAGVFMAGKPGAPETATGAPIQSLYLQPKQKEEPVAEPSPPVSSGSTWLSYLNPFSLLTSKKVEPEPQLPAKKQPNDNMNKKSPKILKPASNINATEKQKVELANNKESKPPTNNAENVVNKSSGKTEEKEEPQTLSNDHDATKTKAIDVSQPEKRGFWSRKEPASSKKPAVESPPVPKEEAWQIKANEMRLERLRARVLKEQKKKDEDESHEKAAPLSGRPARNVPRVKKVCNTQPELQHQVKQLKHFKKEVDDSKESLRLKVSGSKHNLPIKSNTNDNNSFDPQFRKTKIKRRFLEHEIEQDTERHSENINNNNNNNNNNSSNGRSRSRSSTANNNITDNTNNSNISNNIIRMYKNQRKNVSNNNAVHERVSFTEYFNKNENQAKKEYDDDCKDPKCVEDGENLTNTLALLIEWNAISFCVLVLIFIGMTCPCVMTYFLPCPLPSLCCLIPGNQATSALFQIVSFPFRTVACVLSILFKLILFPFVGSFGDGSDTPGSKLGIYIDNNLKELQKKGSFLLYLGFDHIEDCKMSFPLWVYHNILGNYPEKCSSS